MQPLPPELPFSPAAERNQRPWLELLTRLLPPSAAVLEIASGTGQHAAHCAAAQPGWHWQPTELNAAVLSAIALRCAGLPNVAAPLQLDVLAPVWSALLPAAGFDAVVVMNLLHIAPWDVCSALMQGGARHLAPDGRLVIYGPFIVDGHNTAPSNAVFDADLRSRDARWGLRRLDAVQAAASAAGLQLRDCAEMPANNLSLVFGRQR